MLKINKDRHISLRFYVKERLFTKTFLQALAIAVGFHLVGLIFFHISPLQHHDSLWVFPPAFVESEVQKNVLSGTIARLEKEKVSWRGISFPKPSFPSYPNLAIPKEPFKLNQQTTLPLAPPTLFAQIEKKAELTIESFALQRNNPLQLKTSGPLAQHELLEHHLKEAEEGLKKTTLSGTFLLQYSIQMDSRSGRVFWFATEHQPLHPLLEQVGESILQSLRFAQSDKGFATTGNIEILIFL